MKNNTALDFLLSFSSDIKSNQYFNEFGTDFIEFHRIFCNLKQFFNLENKTKKRFSKYLFSAIRSDNTHNCPYANIIFGTTKIYCLKSNAIVSNCVQEFSPWNCQLWYYSNFFVNKIML